MSKIWERYFLKEFLSVFFLFLVCFYSLYVLVDYASHSQHFYQGHFDWNQFFIYYLSEFVRRSEVLIPFALLIATVRSVTKFNQSNELTALRAAGLPLKTLMRPFIFASLCFTALIYVGQEFVLPHSMNLLKHIQDNRSRSKRKSDNAHLAAQHLVLQDESTVIFQHYDASSRTFFDAYWIRSPDEIYRIKTLYPYSVPPLGQFVDRLKRREDGIVYVASSDSTKSFDDMVFNKKRLLETITPLEDLSMSQLWNRLPANGSIESDKEAQIVTAFYRKLIIPWLALFAVIAPLPLCARFSRHIPVFMLYAINIFGLVAVYLIIDAAEVLGKRQIFDPLFVVGIPFLFFLSLFAKRFCTLR